MWVGRRGVVPSAESGTGDARVTFVEFTGSLSDSLGDGDRLGEWFGLDVCESACVD